MTICGTSSIWISFGISLSVAAGCSNDLRIECRSDEQCEIGEVCTFDICLAGDVGDADVETDAPDVDSGADAPDTDADTDSDRADVTCEPQPEICNGVDDDCDGRVDLDDEDFQPTACPLDAGVCEGTEYSSCVAGVPSGGCGEAEYAATAGEVGYDPGFEWHCDGFDNNCDGAVDEACVTEIALSEPPGFPGVTTLFDYPEVVDAHVRDDGSLWVFVVRATNDVPELFRHEFRPDSTHPIESILVGPFAEFASVNLDGEIVLFVIDGDAGVRRCSVGDSIVDCSGELLLIGDFGSLGANAWHDRILIQVSEPPRTTHVVEASGVVRQATIDTQGQVNSSSAADGLMVVENSSTFEFELLSVSRDLDEVIDRVPLSVSTGKNRAALVENGVLLGDFDLESNSVSVQLVSEIGAVIGTSGPEIVMPPGGGDFWGFLGSWIGMPVVALAAPVEGNEGARTNASLFASEAWPLVFTAAGPAALPVALADNGSHGYFVFVVGSATRSVATVQAIPIAPEFVILDVVR